MAEDLLLASDDNPTAEQWQAAVEKVLKGRDFARILVTTTLDGIDVQPLYTADSVATAADEAGFPGFEPLLRGATAAPRDGGRWDIRTRITHPDVATANSQILADLANGATSVDVCLDLGTGTGVSIRDPKDLDRLLAGVVLAAAPVSLRAGAYGTLVGQWFQALIATDGPADEQTSGSLGLDPIGHLAASGELPQGVESALEEAVALARQNPERLRAFVASGAPASDAGASEAQEIGYVLGVGLAYLRALADLPNAGAQITLEVTADVDVFATVAKIRALRHCWATILEQLGQPVDSTQIVAVSADRWLTEVDPWVNLLRGTAATLGAIVGGADTMVLAPFDSALGLPSDLGQRMARNTQLVLQEESGIGRVLDPAGGSWYIESFTDELAAAGWSFFQRIEANGGVVAALDEIGTDIAAVAQRRAAQIATRKRPLTGVSEFPQLDEQRPRPEPTPQKDPRPPVQLAGTPTICTAWPSRRVAKPFEDLRARAGDATVFLANLGPMSAHTARATFAANLFAAGGIQALSDAGHSDPTSAAEAFRASGADIACICSSDDVYTELAADTAAALKAAGASRVYLAGRGDYSGVDEYIHMGCDVLDVLTRAEAAR